MELNNGPVNYLMDYLENAFKQEGNSFDNIFKSIFDDAKSQSAPSDFKEPYPLFKIASGKALNKENLATDVLYKKLLTKDKKFKKEVYENSITVGQIASILKTWKWGTDNPREAKKFFDRFDFSGDVRLNFREFILAMNVHNKDKVSEGSCTHCLSEVVSEVLNPIFVFLDCKGKNLISAEKIWTGLKYLNKRNPDTYNIYTCKVRDDKYRTSAINDFV